MKTIFKNKLLIAIMILFVLFIVGCEDNKNDKGNYKSENYTFFSVYEFEKKLTLEEVKNAVETASNYFSEAKSYSYTQKIVGFYSTEYTYEGVTKIDATGTTPMASVELLGPTEYAFYIANNKAYMNYNGYKTVTDVNADLSDILEKTQSSLGAHVSFDAENITSENLEYAGIDKNGVTVIKFVTVENATTFIVIHDNKIMKVMLNNESGIEYVADYEYKSVTIELPNDLDSYVSQ